MAGLAASQYLVINLICLRIMQDMCQRQHHALGLRAIGENSVLIQLHNIHPADLSIPGYGLFQAYSAIDLSACVRGRGNIRTPVGRILWFLGRGQGELASYPFDFKGLFTQTQIFWGNVNAGKVLRDAQEKIH